MKNNKPENELFFQDSVDIPNLFYGESNDGIGIKEAFKGLAPDSRVRLEWFEDPADGDINIAAYSIRDGRLHKKTFHPLTLCIELSFKQGNDRCNIRLGSYIKAPWFDDIFKKYRPETESSLNKKDVINLIQRVLVNYQEDVVFLLLGLYSKPIHKDRDQLPDDYEKFEKFLIEASILAGSKSVVKKEEDDSPAIVPFWLKIILAIVIVKLVLLIPRIDQGWW